MKHIRTYKIFEAVVKDDIIQYLKDIFQEPIDIGLDVEVDIAMDKSYMVIIEKLKNATEYVSFKYDSILSDAIESSILYMKSVGYSPTVKYSAKYMQCGDKIPRKGSRIKFLGINFRPE